LTITG